MPRFLLLLLLLPLAACQGTGSLHPAPASAEAAPSAGAFDTETIQTYDPQTREFHQQPPFGARSNEAQ